jgi:cysteine synthase
MRAQDVSINFFVDGGSLARPSQVESNQTSPMKNSSNRNELPGSWRIGNTPIIEVAELSDYFGLKHLRIKNEGANHFGTHKDRKSVSVVLNALTGADHLRPEAFCILTAGNAGLSLAKIASVFGLPVTAFVREEGLLPDVETWLQEICERVVPLDLEGKFWSSEELRGLAGENQGRRVVDSTNGVTSPFESIVDEIWEFDEKTAPDVIVLPVGGGELFLGVAEGLRKRKLRTRLWGITVGRQSIADKLYSRWNPQDGELARLVREESHHRFCPLDDEAILLDTFNQLRRVNAFPCEPSSAAAFAALHSLKQDLKPEERVLVINTGTFNLAE